MRRLLLVLLAIAPAAAWAQNAVIDIKLGQGETEAVVGPNDCGRNLSVTWTVNALVQTCDLKVWLSRVNCLNDPGANDKLIRTLSGTFTQTTETFDLLVGDLPLTSATDGGVACGEPGVDNEFNVCGSVKYTNTNSCDTTATEPDPPKIRYDSKAPPAPEITRAEGQDSAVAVTVSVNTGDDACGLPCSVIVVATDPSGAQAARVERDVPAGSIRLGNLTNGTTYTITAQAKDAAGNVSDASAPQQATPVLTSGFFRRYRDAGGSESGGCSAGGGAALGALSAGAGMWLAWRRRRR